MDTKPTGRLAAITRQLRRWSALVICTTTAIFGSAGALIPEIPAEIGKTPSSKRENADIQKQLVFLSSPSDLPSKDCGTTDMNHPAPAVAACVETAFRDLNPFRALYNGPDFAFFQSAYGLAGDDQGNVFQVEYDSRGILNLGAGRLAKVSDNNQLRVMPCVRPIRLAKSEDGIVGCVVPVNEQESEDAAKQEPLDTTVCTVAGHPSVFNNKLVRIHGYASGNFEYSMLSADGCSGSLWFAYGNDDGPPGLETFVNGGARPGAEDSEGRYIRPIPVRLVEDVNFKRFQALMRARARADAKAMKEKTETLTFYRVSATFVGRIDGVSDDVHSFHLKRKETDRADYLGFGQMGLFDVQFVMQSVEGDAVLEPFPPVPNFLLAKPN